MIEGNEPRLPAPAQHDHYGETLLYDFSKFLVSLSLLSLGAMLTISGTAAKGDIKVPSLLIVMGAIAVAGIIAFTTASNLVDARATGKAPKTSLRMHLKFATIAFSIGIGGFIAIWVDTLS